MVKRSILAAALISSVAVSPALASTVNLITNGDFESGNTGFGSSYSFNATNITAAQTYTVTTDPHDQHGSATSYPDHTLGDGTGLMMAINGATSQQTFWAQTVAVTAGTVYDFSLWLSLWYAGAVSVRLEADDVAVGTFSAPDTKGTWEKKATTFSFATSGNVDLKLVNLSTAFGGNDFAVDDISLTAAPAVPLPAGLPLLGGALAAFAALRRRRKA